jgi:hypothetical protein
MATFEGISDSDDAFHLTPEPDTVTISRGGSHDTLYGFEAGQDTLLLSTSDPDVLFDDLEWSEPEPGTLVVDLSALGDAEPGSDTVTFRDGIGVITDADLEFIDDPPFPLVAEPIQPFRGPEPPLFPEPSPFEDPTRWCGDLCVPPRPGPFWDPEPIRPPDIILG